jgi:4-aminobutyrate aminotransferase-like enzyme
MANGHPVGGLVTRAEVMGRFRKSYRCFNTFGGNPVSCAAAMAVLEELQDKHLQAHANRVGAYARTRLADLASRHTGIADVRGCGMVFGAEFVKAGDPDRPATDHADAVVNAMRDEGVLLSRLGRYRNTLKIRPPMPLGTDHVDLMIDTLDRVLARLPVP